MNLLTSADGDMRFHDAFLNGQTADGLSMSRQHVLSVRSLPVRRTAYNPVYI